MSTLQAASEYDTLILQQGSDGYKGCIDAGNFNDWGQRFFGTWRLEPDSPILPILEYRC